jgi:hypothetical protein
MSRYDDRRLVSAEMHCVRKLHGAASGTAGLHTTKITEFIEKYRRNWKKNIGRTSADGIPKNILKY